MRVLDNVYLGWDPFGMVMTVGDWDNLVNWWMKKHFYELDTKEES
tara:strand:+ start:789 stop:923 length:135 start_codon:yes stop_codon:yes gene_type:complete